MYTSAVKTFLTFTTQEKINALASCNTADERRAVIQSMPENKRYVLHGRWSREAILRFAGKRNFKGQITVTYTKMNYSKPSLTSDESQFELELR
ncbi:hypothetical protein NYR72_09995 [Actinobacillus equuli subsp. haemolyticus]|uniref:hypothetical protein n=1 Tax=Actinobacillus equuli TaxID=718 RepID=UPI0024182332|nr:hypothetical protein [Actinobacillus equuli]MDG4948822.1 hypothetical protein [Actinobacillus equuli subsp. haemolyticus]